MRSRRPVVQLAERASNLAGMKVSDTPWASFAPYLIEGLDIFVGPEALIHLGLTGGAAGAVSALASAFPREVAAVVRAPSARVQRDSASCGRGSSGFPARRRASASPRGAGAVRPDVRRPLRDLTAEEAAELDAWLEQVLGA